MLAKLWPMALLALLLLYSGCAQPPPSTPTPAITPAPAPDVLPGNGAVRASGKIVPAQKADLSLPAGGLVQTVPAAVGKRVEVGETLVELDRTAAEAAVIQARAGLFRAQADLAALRTGPRPQEIAAAQASLDAFKARLAQLAEAGRPAALAAAKADLAAAEAARQRLFDGPSEEERIVALAELSNAKAALSRAQSAYDQVSSRNDVGMLPESQELQEATNNYEAAQARYDALFATPDASAAAAASAQIQQAQAALDRLQNPATQSQIAEAEAQVRGAQAELDLLTAGPRDETLAAAAVAITEAAAVLQGAEADLANTEIHAPFTGTVTALSVNPGETVQPGQVVVTLADLDHLQMETTDLSERDVARVAVGQPAIVHLEALATEIEGRVTSIAPEASVIGGDVVFAVVVELDNPPPGLRWGMSGEVEINP